MAQMHISLAIWLAVTINLGSCFLHNKFGITTWPFIKKDLHVSTQAPINILEENTVIMELPKLNIHMNWNLSKETVNITNTGHTLRVTMADGEKDAPLLTNGPLDGVFKLHELHLHWGLLDSCGSEHRINGYCFPEEAHIVFFNMKYETFDIAKLEKDGIAVMALFGEVTDTDNPLMEDLVEKIPYIIQPDTWILGSFYNEFQWLIETATCRYITYCGSLTTPPYTEGVIWIVLLRPFSISHAQLNKFRELISEDGCVIGHNDRELQHYNNQPIILTYDPSPITMIITFDSD